MASSLICHPEISVRQFHLLQPAPSPARRTRCIASTQAVLRILLGFRADVHATDIFGTNALVGAVRYRHETAIMTLVDAGARCVCVRVWREGWQPMSVAFR